MAVANSYFQLQSVANRENSAICLSEISAAKLLVFGNSFVGKEHLRSLTTAEPVTDTGKVRWLWSEIQAALASGKTLREVWEAMQLDGLRIPYPQFRTYVSRLKVRELKARELAAPIVRHLTPEVGSLPNPQSKAVDPFKNLKKQRHEKEQNGFDFDPFSITKDLVG